MKTNLTLLLLTVCVLPFFAFISPEKGVKYTSDKGKYSITFPTQYKLDLTEASEATTYKVSCEMNSLTFFVSHTKHKVELTDTKELAEVSVASFEEGLKAELVSKSDWKVKKNVGLKTEMTIQEGQAKVLYRVILVGKIQYQIVVAGLADSWDQKAADAFFKSFKMKK